ncbi:Uncharacterized protein BM_BM10292 [Brugia malayi]|uniref:BACK domain-containing protein n=3 Tax=Brugia TaxID=6278 RepID=A0A4E9FRW1_BRUMA|nr:Uncharacterized protein BM_BM10292 [Brugia malayi]VIO99917.1 Uncharacterized protein BM_BM10292 [Brugia malayi]
MILISSNKLSKIKSLIRYLRVNFAYIQRNAAWALTNCACSPHEICYKIIQYDDLEALVECAAETDGETRDQVFWALGNIALDCPTCQEMVQSSAALPLMIDVLISPMFIRSKWIRNLIWALSQIIRGGIRTLDIMFVRAALTGLRPVLYLEDSKIKMDAIWAILLLIMLVIDAVLQTPALLERLIELLAEKRTMRAALRALGNLVAGNDAQTQAVLNAGLLPRMMELFGPMMPINQKHEIMWILSNIAAGSQRQIDLLFETNDIVEILIGTFYNDDHRIRKEIGWTVINALTGASENRSRWLCASNVLSIVPHVLNMHAEHDLIERTLDAIELLIEKQINYFFILENYQIMEALRQIAQNQNNCYDMHIKMWYGRSQEGVPQLQQRLVLDVVWVVPGDIRKYYLQDELRTDRLEAEVYLKWSANIGFKNRVKIVLENGYSCNAPACLLVAFSDIFRKLISSQVTSLVSLICEEMTARILENTSPPISLLYSAIACLAPQSQYRNMVVDGAAIKFHDILANPEFLKLSFEMLYALISSPVLQGPEWVSEIYEAIIFWLQNNPEHICYAPALLDNVNFKEIIHVADNRQEIMKKSLDVPDLGPIVQLFLMDAIYAKFVDHLTSPQNRNQSLSSSIYTVSGAETAIAPDPLRGTLGLASSPLGSYIIPPFDSVSSVTTRSISNETSVSVDKNWRPAQQLPIGSGSSRNRTARNDPILTYSNVPITTSDAAANDDTAGAIGGGAAGIDTTDCGVIDGDTIRDGVITDSTIGNGAIDESAEIRTSSSQESASNLKRRPKFEQIPLRTEPPKSRKELRKERQAREKTDTK